MQTSEVSPFQPGLRERNKQQKLERIRQAAWELFHSKGFEATTTREVAELAQIAVGTLFLYVKDKQELLVLIYDEAIEKTMETAFSTIPENATLLDELVHIFGSYFRFYHQNPELARAYVQALLFQSKPGQRQQAATQIERFSKRIAERIVQAQARGELGLQIEVGQACRNFFALYSAALTGWLSGMVGYEETVNSLLRRSLELQIQGLLPD